MKLHAVGLRGAHRLMPSELSGGMARRVALARAIALDPMLIMYDEPFTGLDPISLGVIRNLIRRLNDALGATSIVVTHDVQEALEIVDYVYYLSDGEVVAHGTPRGDARQRRAPGASVRVWRGRRPGAVSVSEQKLQRGSEAGSAPCLNVQPLSVRSIGHFTIDSVLRLGYAARFIALTLLHSGTSFRRFGLIIRELYFTGVLSLIIILVSGLFVGMVLGLQGYETLQDLWFGIRARRAGGAVAGARAGPGGRRRCCSPAAPVRP